MDTSMLSTLMGGVTSTTGVTTQVVIAIIALVLLFKLAFYTVKKVVLHLVTGYIAFLAITSIFNIPVHMGVMMWALTAMFGPLPVIGLALWHTM